MYLFKSSRRQRKQVLKYIYLRQNIVQYTAERERIICGVERNIVLTENLLSTSRHTQ